MVDDAPPDRPLESLSTAVTSVLEGLTHLALKLTLVSRFAPVCVPVVSGF